MTPMSAPRRTGHSLNDVARQLAPHLRIISASRPTPLLRDHNVIAIASDAEVGRRAVLALESIEHADDQLGTVVMGAVPAGDGQSVVDDDGNGRVDPEGVGRQVIPRVLIGALLGAVVGAVVVGAGALLLGATGWRLGGSAAAGAALGAAFGAIWLTFAGLGGSDAYRQTFVDADTSELTLVSVHTDDPEEAEAANARLHDTDGTRVLIVDRFGQVVDEPPPSSNTQ
jgi:hypothetical protein